MSPEKKPTPVFDSELIRSEDRTDTADSRELTHTRPHSERVNEYFAAKTSYWTRIYQEDTLYGRIYQERKAIALQWTE